MCADMCCHCCEARLHSVVKLFMVATCTCVLLGRPPPDNWAQCVHLRYGLAFARPTFDASSFRWCHAYIAKPAVPGEELQCASDIDHILLSVVPKYNS